MFPIKITTLAFVLCFVVKENESYLPCVANSLICVDSTLFQECALINGRYDIIGLPFSCAVGYVCDDSSGVAQCVAQSTTTTTTTTTPAPATCTAGQKSPAPACYQYYQCVYTTTGYQYQLALCPTGQYFDIYLNACNTASLVACDYRVTSTTTTTTPSPGPPDNGIVCTATGKYLSSSCYQYYSCLYTTAGLTAVLESCPDGYAFDSVLKECAVASLVNCDARFTTSTTTQSAEPLCTTVGQKFRTTDCYSYYECELNSYYYEAVLKICPTGYAYDVSLKVCAVVANVDCTSRTTTTTTTTTTQVPQVCSAGLKYAATLCNQYYECVAATGGWDVMLRTCPTGQAFSSTYNSCVAEQYVAC